MSLRATRLCLLVALGCALLPATGRAALSAEEIELKVAIEERREEMQARLAEWVDRNTGSFNEQGLRAFAAELAAPLQQLGFEVELEESEPVSIPGHGDLRAGPTLIARRLQPSGERPRFLLVGHYDTVFEPGSEFQHFEVSDGSGRARGPGIADMKGGLVVLLYALRGLADAGELDRASFSVVLNGDEEIGSLASRSRIEQEAQLADYGLVFEASYGRSMVRSRRGLGQFHLEIEGVAAHAGNAHARGRSAIRELAHKILEIEALTDYERGITLNVGTVLGGDKRNIVPSRAEAWVDLRYDDPESGEQVRQRLQQIAERTFVEGTRTRLWGTLHRPPKLETEQVRLLLDRQAAVVRDLGMPTPERVHSGGGTDGSLMGAVGLATLDSMGVIGGDAHTDEEFVTLDSLTERATIAALLILRLIEDPVVPVPDEGVEGD
jgi:glutamate carboxypeptidase